MNEDIRVTKSFDFAADVTKQLIALSTAIISLCVAFTDKIFSSVAAQNHSYCLLLSLGAFVTSIIFGIITLMALAGHLGNPKNENRKDGQHEQPPQPAESPTEQSPKAPSSSPIYKGNVRLFSILQMVTFVAAIIMAMFYVFNASKATRKTPAESQNSGKHIKVIRVSNYNIENGQVIDTLSLDPRMGQ